MSFADISERFFSAPPAEKAAATLEYRVASGPFVAPGIQAADESTLLRADGRIEYRRRGDFGERGECPPGVWTARCEAGRVEVLWDKLGDLGPDSFPGRVADPGDAIRYLTACVPDRLETLAIGPSDPGRPVPGQPFLDELYPILGQPEDGVCLWAAVLDWAGIREAAGGVEIDLRFSNPGAHSIGLVFDGAPGASDFRFRFAQDREEIPYPEWRHAACAPGQADALRLVLLQPGGEYRRTVFFPCAFPDRGGYLGAVSYRQTALLDSLAGHPVLTGMAFTAMTGFDL